MVGQQLIIGFKHDRAYLAPNKALTFGQLDFSESIKFRAEVIWTIQVLHFSPSDKRIFVQILSYQIGSIKFPESQLSLYQLNDIEKINVKGGIDTQWLLKLSASTIPTDIIPMRGSSVAEREPAYERAYSFIHEPQTYTQSIPFSISLKDVHFKHRGVSFDKKFKGLNQTREITIPNHYIRGEFDAIKNYFVNVLKTKKINVVATVETVNGNIISVSAESAEIAQIDEKLVEIVKFEFLKRVIKNGTSTETDKCMFTIDELFDTFAADAVKSEAFYKNDEEFIEDLIKISKPKHYHHLSFLSKKHAHDLQRLRFVQSPFSFIFLIKGNKNYHIIWETFNTEEATYVWDIGNDTSVLQVALKKIEDTISKIKTCGKRSYKNETEDLFIPIDHDYSDLTGGFEKWKRVLEMVLT